MPAGLMIWDPNGKVRVDLTHRYCRFLGSFRVTANGSRNIPALSQGTPFFIVSPISSEGSKGKRPVVTVSGTTVTYQYLYASGQGYYSQAVDIYYGVY